MGKMGFGLGTKKRQEKGQQAWQLTACSSGDMRRCERRQDSGDTDDNAEQKIYMR